MATQLDATQFDAGDNNVKFSDLFEFQRVLGNGSFGVVVAALQKPHMKECAVKIIMKKSLRTRNLENLWKESQILQQLDHPHIVKFIGINESETRIFIVMELVRGGQLQHLIQEKAKAGKPLSDEEAATIMRSIFAGLRYIHLKDIVHRDLKPENILLNDKNDLSSVKICDFGLSAQYNDATCTRSFNEKCGTDIFMAPELWKKKRYSKPVDMWSCGIIMYMLLSGGKHPLHKPGDTQESYFKKVQAAQWPMLPNFNKYSKDLFLKLVLEEPCERYSVEQVQDHPWITRRFNEDIPLTSSEKIAAFSHSQSLSRILKSIYLMYSVPEMTLSKMKAIEAAHDQSDAELLEVKPKLETKSSKSAKSEEETCHGFGSGSDSNSIKIPIIEEEESLSPPKDRPSERNTFEAEIIPKLKFPNTPLMGRDSTTPTASGLTRKTGPSFSSQMSTTKNTVKTVQTRRDKDFSCLGSLAELETTHGSNQGSQQEEKNSKCLPSSIELAVHTEPMKTLEDERVRGDRTNAALWALDKAMYSTGNTPFGRRRDSKSNKIPEEVANGRYQGREASSIDVGNRSGTKASAGKQRNVENEAYVTSFVSVGGPEKMKVPTSLQNADHFQTTRNIMNSINVVTPVAADSIYDLQMKGGDNDRTPTGSDKRVEEVSRKQIMKNKAKKENVSEVAALPGLGKIKQRQNSLSIKKKNASTSGKDKTAGRTGDGQKSLNVTGSGRPTALSGEGASSRNMVEEKRLDLSCKKTFEENRLETRQDSKRVTPFPMLYKTPMKENKEEGAGLPMIKQEMRKTKLSWANSSEKGLSQRKNGTITSMTPVFHRPGNKLTKVVGPFKYKE